MALTDVVLEKIDTLVRGGEELGGPAIGRVVAQELTRAGLRVVWDGTFKTRIHLPELVWQRR